MQITITENWKYLGNGYNISVRIVQHKIGI
jgi:hypothetical protein